MGGNCGPAAHLYDRPAIEDYGSIFARTAHTVFPGLSAPGCVDHCSPGGGGGGGGGGGDHGGGGGGGGGGTGGGGGGGGTGGGGGGTGGGATTTPPAGGTTGGGVPIAGGTTGGVAAESSGHGPASAVAAVAAVAGATLPFTGFPIWAAVLIAIALLMVGSALVWWTRGGRATEHRT